MIPRLSLNSVRTRLALWNVGVLALVLVVVGIAFRLRMEYAGVAEIDRALAGGAQSFQAMAARPPHHGGPAHGGPAHGGWDHGNPANDAPAGHWPEEGGPPPDGGPPEDGGPPPLPGNRMGSHDNILGSHDSRASRPNVFQSFRPRVMPLPGQPPLGPPEDAASESGGPWDPAAYALSRGGRTVSSTVTVGGEPLRVLSFPLRRDGKMAGVGQFAASLTPLRAEAGRMTRTLLTLIPLALLIAGLGGAFLTDRALRPVRDVTQAAGRIEAEDLSGRLPVTGSDEFASLADTFNAMLGRLEKSFVRLEAAYEQQRRFTADASHELRTPLTVIKANTSLALLTGGTAEDYRRALQNADAAADRTARLVQDLLLLARADAGELAPRREPVCLTPLLTQAAESVSGPGLAAIRVCLSDALPCLTGDGDALRRALGNLLENAARHTPPDGSITLSASAEERAGRPWVAICVSDTGAGIAPEHLPHVFERFYRADAARVSDHGGQGGTGLGLAICRSIVEAHGGTIAMESEAGAGTTVRVMLPVSENPL